MARPSLSASAGSTSSRPRAASISRASARVSSTTSSGPPPASTSTDSRTSMALPAVSPSGTCMLVSSATVVTPASVPRSTMVRASSRASSTFFMNAPLPDLDVEHERAGALGDLLAHDRRGDERDGLDGAGDVAQGVELLVGRRQAVTRRADDGADVLELPHHLLVAHRRPPARGSTRACRGCRRCGRARGRTAGAPRRRTPRPAGPAAG